MPVRIAHITASPNFGGVERIILETGCCHKRTKDVEQIFATFSKGGKEEPFLREIEKAGLTTYRFQNDMPHLFAQTCELIRLLQQHQTQILCAHVPRARILGWFAAKRLRIPIIGVSHGWPDESGKLYNRIDQWMHRRMDHVVCVSQGQADKIIRYGTPASRVSVIHNAVRTDRFDVPSDISYRHRLEAIFPHKPKLIVGAAGRLSSEKGCDILITAAEKLLKSGLDVGFVIFGEGFLREPLQKQIDEAGIASSFVMPGYADPDLLDQYRHHFDLFVLSSRREAMSTVLLEAMAARTAIVATQVEGTGELMVEGVTGLMVPPNNPEALAEAMRKVLSDDELRRTMGENGRQRVEQHFTFEPQAEKYWELFCRLLRK